jgi:kynureninase
MNYASDITFAQKMDAADPLAGYRQKFHIPKTPTGDDVIYFCGNSLGLQPVTVAAAVKQDLDDWKNLGVEGHFHGKIAWKDYHEALTVQAAHVVGAKPVEVVMMNNLTVNLHLMMVSFYRPTKTRHKILIEGGAFPSDQYAVKSQISFHGFDPATSLVELKHGEDIEALLDREGESIALVLLGGVNYYTGQLFDIAKITKLAHKKGCIAGFDLAHAAGNVVLQLHDWDVDFACWCSYKYLNAGPGGTAGCFVHERFANDSTLPRFSGWWGHEKQSRFKMGPDFRPIPGAEGWQLSNPSILSMAAAKASLDIFYEAKMENLRAKSILLTGYLEYLLGDGVDIITPRAPAERGCQLSIRVGKEGRKIFDALTWAGVICDWREPDCIRVAPVPLYNSFMDVYRFAQIFAKAAA